MTSETGFYDELLLDFGFGELEEEDSGGKVINVGNSEGDKTGGQLVSDDLT